MVDKIVSLQQRFLWGGRPEHNKIAWIKWETVCLPKEKGELGLKDIKTFNLALLGKWKWNLFQHQGQLWARVLESKYGGWRSLDTTSRVTNESIWWRDFKMVFLHTQQGRALQNGTMWKVGCGDRIKFWEDRWVSGKETLSAKYPRLYLISCQQNQIIRKMGDQKDIGWEWDFIWRRPLLDNEIATIVSFLRDVEGKIIQQHRSDVWVWKANPSGNYSGQSAYHMLRGETTEGSQNECFEELWKIKIPRKISVFVWRLLRDRLLTRTNLQRRQVQINDLSCPFYKSMEEDSTHLFIHCNKIQPIWWESLSWLNIQGVFPQTPNQHFL